MSLVIQGIRDMSSGRCRRASISHNTERNRPIPGPMIKIDSGTPARYTDRQGIHEMRRTSSVRDSMPSFA